MKREEASDCQVGDWMLIMAVPDWDSWQSFHSWLSPEDGPWSFMLTSLPIMNEEGEEVGEDYVWKRVLTNQPDKADPVLYLFGGCNGAGKTTFAKAYLTTLFDAPPRFLNADEIARGLSPFAPRSVAFKAGRILLEEIEVCLMAKVSFALESTLSGHAQVAIIQRAKAAGYRIEIHYLWIPSPSLAVRRVAQRVRKGGHHIPTADIHRRYQRSINNFVGAYASLADAWFLWRNVSEPPQLILESGDASLTKLRNLLHP
ncbi:zeta toxin family protein [Luteolibacter sp. GHJ8]|uniref:Zeta toxin family protein n=1 Tax=Luteolibacter rhizosphaerae TaxID=2989719 RepID=A0ABT3G7Q6_9BACT|nr:zeta toxin family protein [Luteolibacter rhizosphaerae]MCW1915609.1 zeta toxin family protein [Luteolibacter rhizosphaerae]